MKSEPLVSVVSTVYNGARHIGKALPSILAQDYENFEYVIVDDGSTDNTVELIKQAIRQDGRVKLLRPGRLGRAGALNYAIENSTGGLIAIQDFDDISYPHRLSRQVEYLVSRPKLGLLGAYYVLDDQNRGERYIRKPPTEDCALRRAMAKNIPFAHTMVMFRKEVWQQVGGYPDVDDIVDLSLWVRFAATDWQFGTVPEVLGEHFVYSESYWHSNFRYQVRQRHLARVQMEAVRVQRLPIHMYAFPLARLAYAFLPNGMKRLVRRRIVGSNEAPI